MGSDINRSERRAARVHIGSADPWYAHHMDGTIRDETQQARDTFFGWLRWYQRTHPTELPSDAAVAKALGITPSGLSQLWEPGSRRAPSLRVMVAAKRLTGFSIDQLLYGKVPAGNAPRRG